MSHSAAIRHLDVSLAPPDNVRLQNLCGPLDENLRQISAALDLSIFRRGDKFIVSGDNAERGLAMLEHFYSIAKKIISGVNAGEGSLGKLVKDEKLYAETTAAMTNIKEIAQKINQVLCPFLSP